NPSPELRFRVELEVQSPKSKVQSLEKRVEGRASRVENGTRNTEHGTRIRHPPSTIHHPVPLKVHSYYSFLDSTLSPKAIVDLAKRHELPAIALTDKNNLHGAVEFAQAAAQAGIKPIIGAELDWHGHRVCLYVENQKGYHNLCRILNAVVGRVCPRAHLDTTTGAP